jgi:hypothetical protein
MREEGGETGREEGADRDATTLDTAKTCVRTRFEKHECCVNSSNTDMLATRVLMSATHDGTLLRAAATPAVATTGDVPCTTGDRPTRTGITPAATPGPPAPYIGDRPTAAPPATSSDT